MMIISLHSYVTRYWHSLSVTIPDTFILMDNKKSNLLYIILPIMDIIPATGINRSFSFYSFYSFLIGEIKS